MTISFTKWNVRMDRDLFIPHQMKCKNGKTLVYPSPSEIVRMRGDWNVKMVRDWYIPHQVKCKNG